MDNEETVDQWLAEHRVRVVDTNKRAHRSTRMDVRLFAAPENYNIFYSDSITARQALETEPLYTIEISKSELERVSKFEKQVFNNMKERGHYALFEAMAEQKERERYLASKYPAVKKAFEHYSLILHLAESGEL